jgi:cardiolipin synthase A/B
MLSTRMIRRLLTWSLAIFFAAQALVISILLVIDAWRKRSRSQGRFPRSRPPSVRVGHSEVHLYTYGEDLYAAMLHAIRQAQERIVVETFIWKDDPIGQQFKQELSRAAERGVDVSIIFDSFANLVVPRRFKRFPAALHVLEYPLFSWPWHPFHLRSYARDHRKILVVDGHTGFVGGYNIGSLYATEWRDTHACITGPDAWELENVFINFWNAHRGRHLPAIPERGTRDWDPRINIHRNDPQLLIFPIRTTYLEAIDRARQHVYLTHAYFIPDRIILRALLAAARRGVDVCILLPTTSNHILADWLARGYYMQCLKGGIRLLLYQHAMVHAKTATIDSAWSTVGTANMDRLSMVGNFEVNVEVYDEAMACQMEDIFSKDASNCHELTLEEWRQRSLLEKLAETILLPLRPLL